MNNSIYDAALAYMQSRKLPISGWELKETFHSKARTLRPSFTGGTANEVRNLWHPDIEESHLVSVKMSRILLAKTDKDALLQAQVYRNKVKTTLQNAGLKTATNQPAKAPLANPVVTVEATKEELALKVFLAHKFDTLPSGDEVGNFQGLDCYFGQSSIADGYCARVNLPKQKKNYSPVAANAKTLKDIKLYAFENMIWPKINVAK